MSQQTYTFQAEIQQLLNILVHSLYTDREIFLRELISNASDALHRVQFEMLTNDNVADPDAELRIGVYPDEETGTLTISDTGIGMTQEDMVNNLGVIARSGAKAFIEAMQAAQGNGPSPQDVIGQFGVGFYSVFMVADKVRVVSRSYQPDAEACFWESEGGDEYIVGPAERDQRGTDIIITLKEDAKEFLQDWELQQIIRRHSDYIPFPIYLADGEEPANERTAIWRQSPKEVTDEQYEEFYRMLTMDFMGKPLHRIHLRADVPLQFYALLYIPSSAELNMFSPRREPGLKLYARKVLIQEYSKDLLPEYLQFVQGVVDSEDLPLNVSRESVQASRVMANLKKTITGRVLNELKRMAQKRTGEYLHIYEQFGRFIKQGLVVAPEDREDILPLLFFTSTHNDDPEDFHSLDDYVGRMVPNQQDIYYIVGDDFQSARRSPHLDAFRQRGIEVLYFTDPVDSAMLMGLTEYKDHRLRSVDEADIDLSGIGEEAAADEKSAEPLTEDAFQTLQERFAAVLGERVREVRASKSLTGSPARLVSDESGASRQMFRIHRLLDREYELPVKMLELNPRHPLLHNLNHLLAGGGNDALVDAVIEQVFETALLQDGIHPDPAAMAARLTVLMQAATGSAANELDFSQLVADRTASKENMTTEHIDPVDTPDAEDKPVQ
jgi:HSP90 family molecular chaperone